jgi:aspartyl/asparaginyl beta-hydroxylase (cupin superfamily)
MVMRARAAIPRRAGLHRLRFGSAFSQAGCDLGFWRQVSDHFTVMAPYNVLMYLFGAESVDPAGRDDNRWLSTHIINESATQNGEGKRVGWINRVVSSVYQCTLPASG